MIPVADLCYFMRPKGLIVSAWATDTAVVVYRSTQLAMDGRAYASYWLLWRIQSWCAGRAARRIRTCLVLFVKMGICARTRHVYAISIQRIQNVS